MVTTYVPGQRKLTPEAHASFTLFFHQYPGKSCAELCELRPDLFKGVYLRAAQNRHGYLLGIKNKKETNSDAYWKAILKAQNKASALESETLSMNDENYEPDFQSSWGGGDTMTPSNQSKRTRSSTSKPPSPFTSPSKPSSSTKKLSTPISSRTAFSPSIGGNSKPHTRRNLFQTLQEAIEFCDIVIMADEALPEFGGHDLFFQRLDHVKSPDDKCQYSKIKISYYGQLDLRDFPLFKVNVVLNGTAVLLRKPTVPFFALHGHAEILAKDAKPCERAVTTTHIQMNEIGDDETRQITHILIVMPKGICVNANFDDDTITPVDQKVKFLLRNVSNTVSFCGKTADQFFFPAHFEMLVVGSVQNITQQAKVEDTLEDAFQGGCTLSPVSSPPSSPRASTPTPPTPTSQHSVTNPALPTSVAIPASLPPPVALYPPIFVPPSSATRTGSPTTPFPRNSAAEKEFMKRKGVNSEEQKQVRQQDRAEKSSDKREALLKKLRATNTSSNRDTVIDFGDVESVDSQALMLAAGSSQPLRNKEMEMQADNELFDKLEEEMQATLDGELAKINQQNYDGFNL